jgi:hypothetical protein
MTPLAEAISATSEPTFCLHGGDWVMGDYISGSSYSRGLPWSTETDELEWDVLMRQLAPITDGIPILGCMGNHDYAVVNRVMVDLFHKYYPYPYEIAGCWSFDFGNVRVVVVDFERLARSALSAASWLIEAVEQARSRPWTVLLIHDAGGLVRASRDRLATAWQWPEVTLLEALRARGLDLIVSGHYHGDDFCLWDGADPYWADGSTSGGMPLLVMALAFGSYDPGYYYRFTAASSAMTIDVFDVAGDLYRSYSLTSRP